MGLRYTGNSRGHATDTRDPHIRAKRASVKPSSIRRKAESGEARGDERALVRISESSTRVITGQEDLSQWSEEELIRGQKKDRNGKYQGKPPLVVPKALHDELVKRKMSRAFELLRDNLVSAVEVLIELAQDEEVESGTRLKAATTIIERVMGKTPEKVVLDMGEQPPWLGALMGAIVSVKNENVVDVDAEEE
jgi:hypothetical protein